jgi:small GTP-binding protein
MSDFSEQSHLPEQIKSIKKEIRETPYHKGTEHHIGRLKARLARLKDKEIESQIKAKGGGGRGVSPAGRQGFAVKKHGDATVVLIGPPSAGKSTLLNKLTNAESKVAAYSFTTVSVIPGMMIYKDAYIQILDVPGLIEGAKEGRGRGKEVLSVARVADLLLFMTDVDRPNIFKTLLEELEESGIRVNKEKPDIRLEKKTEGGIEIHSNIKQQFDDSLLKDIAYEMGIRNVDITLKEKVSLERLIDSFSYNRIYLPALFLINKIDLVDNSLGKEPNTIYISAEKGTGLDNLREKIWQSLGLIKIFLVKPGQEPNFGSPIIMKKGQAISDILPKLGSSFETKYSMAKVWGAIAKFPGQKVSLSTKLVDGLQVKLI